MKIRIPIDEAAYRTAIRERIEASGLEFAIRAAVDEEAARVNALYRDNTLECALARIIHRASVQILSVPPPEGPDIVEARLDTEDLDRKTLDALKGSALGRILHAEVHAKARAVLDRYPDGSLKKGLAETIFAALIGRTIDKQFPEPAQRARAAAPGLAEKD